jgi:peptidyl-prolyl cis-trans isomerase B (cyclophilin B)
MYEIMSVIIEHQRNKNGKEDFMKLLMSGVLSVMIFLVAVSAHSEVRHRVFTIEERAGMARAIAVVETKFGNIEIRFFPEAAPNHVNNFIELAKKGFYNGTVFHRVIPGVMIQGGDPNSKDKDRIMYGKGGPGYTLKAEFNDRPHMRGTLSMARSGHPDSAGSRFFICIKDSPWLDGQYTVFGEVVSGMDVADKIVGQPRDKRDNPNERVEMTITIIDE